MALKFIDFTFGTVDATKRVVEMYAAEESEMRAVTRVHSFRDQALFEAAQRSVTEFQRDRPEYEGTYTVISGEEAAKDYDIHGVVGAILYPGYSLWPYRFITSFWKALLEEYAPRLTVEANTPVVDITYDPSLSTSHPYTLHTPRGQLQAAKIIHCTNGYSSHLLPPLRGLVFPYLEAMTVQDPHVSRRETRCWAIIQRPTEDLDSEAKTSELCYLQQNLKTGYYFFGGGYVTAADVLSANDAVQHSRSTAYLRETLHGFLGVQPGTGNLVSEWTGVQGMTSDHLPLVGKLPGQLTGRCGDGEWIAAGFNGGGMCMCWRVGEAVARMVDGEEPPAWLPEPFLLSAERLQSALKVDNSLAGVSHLLPGQGRER
ncbi:FAD dependent oxidoreductase [Aspergillus similis]